MTRSSGGREQRQDGLLEVRGSKIYGYFIIIEDKNSNVLVPLLLPKLVLKIVEFFTEITQVILIP